MATTISATLLRRLRNLVGGAFLVLASIWTINAIRFLTMTVELPNGAVIARSLDPWKGTRADLYATRHGPLLVRDVDMICYDATAIDGGYFLWMRGEEKVSTSRDPDHLARLRDTELWRKSTGCRALSGGFVSGDLLLRDPRRILEATGLGRVPEREKP